MFQKLSHIIIAIYVVLAVVLITSCGHDKMIDQVETLMKSNLYLPEECRPNTEYTVLRYISPKSCTSCQLEMGRWRVYKKRIEKNYQGKVGLLFIIDTDNVKEAKRLTSMYGFSDYIYMDSVGDFLRNNPSIDSFGSDVVMLLDSVGSIVAVGNPVKDERASKLYENMVSNHVINDLK